VLSFILRTEHPQITLLAFTSLKEYARVEEVLAELGVALELAADLSHENRVPEMVEYCEKVSRNYARPHVDVVPDRNGTGTCLTRADT
jgi:hypothetical protein